MMTTPQIEEFVFPHADLPREFDIQLWAFVRLVRGEFVRGDDRFRTRSWNDPTPTHFVRAAGRRSGPGGPDRRPPKISDERRPR